jgi:hypothetical protein
MRSMQCNVGTNSAFALGPRTTTENLDRVGRSQDLPDANRLLTNLTQSQSHFSTNSQSVSTSWCQAHCWAFDQKFVF